MELPFCHKNSAASYAHIRYPRFFSPRGEENIAGPADLDTLADVDPLAARSQSVPHQVADGAASG